MAKIVAVANQKGGVGKTTTAIHFATYFEKLAPTLLLDGDLNRSSLRWAESGKLPFKVIDHRPRDGVARGFPLTD